MSEKQIPQVVENIENAQYGMEPLESGVVLRRQTLYPPELRARGDQHPDSKALPEFVATPVPHLRPRGVNPYCETVLLAMPESVDLPAY